MLKSTSVGAHFHYISRKKSFSYTENGLLHRFFSFFSGFSRVKSGKKFFVNYFTLFSQAHLFVFKNRYEINDDTVFLSFVLKNLILIIKHNRKVKFSIELFTFHLYTSAKLKTCFSRKESWKKCTSFEEQKGASHIQKCSSANFRRQNRVPDFFCFAWEIKSFYKIFWGNEADFRDVMYKFPRKSWLNWFRCKGFFKVFQCFESAYVTYCILVFLYFFCLILWITEQRRIQCQKSKMELFLKIVKDWNLLKSFTKRFMADASQGSEYAFAEHKVKCLPRFAIY